MPIPTQNVVTYISFCSALADSKTGPDPDGLVKSFLKSMEVYAKAHNFALAFDFQQGMKQDRICVFLESCDGPTDRRTEGQRKPHKELLSFSFPILPLSFPPLFFLSNLPPPPLPPTLPPHQPNPTLLFQTTPWKRQSACYWPSC